MRESSQPSDPPPGPVGYRELVRTNIDFRRLWIGHVISLLGDWFNTIALYSLVSRLTGSPFALGAVFLFKMLPLGLASPVAGILVDRWNRRRVMIGSDLLRAGIVLGFLVVDEPGEVPFLYLLIALQVVVGAFFQPARSASIPNIVSRRELLTANALSSASWSIMLAVGAALGGLATEAIGERNVFLVDSATYLVSAIFVYRTRIPQETEAPPPGSPIRAALSNLVDGWRYLRRVPRVGRIAFAKAAWSLGGGGLVYWLALLGQRVAPAAQAAGIGVLFAVRGLGTGIGPILGRRLFPDSRIWPTVMGLCIVGSGIAYVSVGLLPATLVVVVPILLAHAASGANWVFASVLLQGRSEDRFRGRLFATEWLLIMTADSLSILAASLLLETGLLDLPGVFLAFAGLQVLCGLLWLLGVVPRERRESSRPGHPRGDDAPDLS